MPLTTNLESLTRLTKLRKILKKTSTNQIPPKGIKKIYLLLALLAHYKQSYVSLSVDQTAYYYAYLKQILSNFFNPKPQLQQEIYKLKTLTMVVYIHHMTALIPPDYTGLRPHLSKKQQQIYDNRLYRIIFEDNNETNDIKDGLNQLMCEARVAACNTITQSDHFSGYVNLRSYLSKDQQEKYNKQLQQIILEYINDNKVISEQEIEQFRCELRVSVCNNLTQSNQFSNYLAWHAYLSQEQQKKYSTRFKQIIAGYINLKTNRMISAHEIDQLMCEIRVSACNQLSQSTLFSNYVELHACLPVEQQQRYNSRLDQIISRHIHENKTIFPAEIEKLMRLIRLAVYNELINKIPPNSVYCENKIKSLHLEHKSWTNYRIRYVVSNFIVFITACPILKRGLASAFDQSFNEIFTEQKTEEYKNHINERTKSITNKMPHSRLSFFPHSSPTSTSKKQSKPASTPPTFTTNPNRL